MGGDTEKRIAIEYSVLGIKTILVKESAITEESPLTSVSGALAV